MAGQLPIREIEPHYTELLALYQRNQNRLTRARIFELWTKAIAPDKPVITFQQFVNHVNYLREKEHDDALMVAAGAPVDQFIEKRNSTLVQLEEELRPVASDLINEARQIMDLNNTVEGGMPLKERYYALNTVVKIWDKLQKEKAIAIKAHAEKRESVGLFAKLLKGAMSGEFTMQDVEVMRKNYATATPQPTQGS